jgi:DNA-directed RNA polymerase subunit beta'
MELLNFLNNLAYPKTFDKIRLGLASPEQIRSWSYGEIKTSETINYRTFKPENEGLFCAKTFGPINNYECLCGKYKLFKHKGIICEKCGVEVTKASVRRERMGHVELAAPVVHTWYLKSLPSRIGLLLDMSLRDLERILYFDAYVIVEPGFTPLKRYQLLSESAYLEAFEAYGRDFEAQMGGAAIYELLRSLDLVVLEDQLRDQLDSTNSEIVKKRVIKRLMLVQALLEANHKPEWMVLTVLPILPPDLRPLVSMDIGGRFTSSDLNELYRQVLNRNNRAKRLFELKAPETVIRNELRMLQEAVDALFDNGRRHRAFTGSNKQPLHSLSDMLKGKQGRFRQHLLRKRVDYAGRSVITVNPTLNLSQCGLPKEMALELFKPFLYHQLQERGFAISVLAAKQLVEQRIPDIWPILEEVVKQHPVLLNRAPTLYRLGIQAFEPVLIDSKAIQLHPLVCKGFKANFNGDQMVVHVPLSLEAQLEARVLMMPNRNLLSPINGKPLLAPVQEMVLGLYYMTCSRENARGEGMMFADSKEVQRAYDNGIVDLQASIEVRMPRALIKTQQSPGQKSKRNLVPQLLRVKTTVGRVLLSQTLPKNLSFYLINHCLTEKKLDNLISLCHRRLGLEQTLIWTNQLMLMGFSIATRAGISIKLDDIKIPTEKPGLIKEALAAIAEIQTQFQKTLITNNQRHNQIIEIWNKINEKMAATVLNHLSAKATPPKRASKPQKSKKQFQLFIPPPENDLYMMVNAGIQNLVYLHQLGGMCGLMTKPDGSILESPITANYREGLDTHQYFISTHGIRKWLTDASLKTANSGYLTRRLVDVAQDIIISEPDCGTSQGINLNTLTQNNQIIESLGERMIGRVVADNIYLKNKSKPVIKAGTLLDDTWLARIEQWKITQIKVRSPITCQSKRGICAKCYGHDLAQGQLIQIGEAVGVIAAQSIGEAGTQLSMRTYKVGKIANQVTPTYHLEIRTSGTIQVHNLKFIQESVTKPDQKSANKPSQFMVVSHAGEITVHNRHGKECERHKIPYGTILTSQIMDNAKVKAGDIIAQLPFEPPKVRNLTDGLLRVADLFEARMPKEPAILAQHAGTVSFGKKTKTKQRCIVTNPEGQLEEHSIPKGRPLEVSNGQQVEKGEVVVNGALNPHDVLSLKGPHELIQYLLNELQEIYNTYGVKINDKHFEVIIRQMLCSIVIIEPGDTPFFSGQYVTLQRLEKENQAIAKQAPKSGRLATWEPNLLGITKASLTTESFISAASFIDTTRTLLNSAITGKTDELQGLKENLILGRLIPAGTGFQKTKRTRIRKKKK